MPKLEQYSYSKLATFEQCKYQYWLTYIKKIKGESNAFSEFGSFVHFLCEQYEKGHLAVYELADKYLEDYFNTIQHEFPPNKYVDLGEKYYQDGLNFLYDFEGLDDYKILGAEDEFTEEIDDPEGKFRIKGFVDLEYEDPNGLLVVHDWKSMSKFKSKAEQEHKARQLYMYALRIYRKFGRYPDLLRFYLFRKQKSVDIKFNMDDYNKAWDWVHKTVSDIRHCSEFPASYDKFFCDNLCDFRNVCEQKE